MTCSVQRLAVQGGRGHSHTQHGGHSSMPAGYVPGAEAGAGAQRGRGAQDQGGDPDQAGGLLGCGQVGAQLDMWLTVHYAGQPAEAVL